MCWSNVLSFDKDPNNLTFPVSHTKIYDYSGSGHSDFFFSPTCATNIIEKDCVQSGIDISNTILFLISAVISMHVYL